MTAGQKAYRVFLQSAFWKELSLRVREAAGKCKRCRETTRLQAHHVRYPKDWYETTEADLVALCRKCHAKAHGRSVGRRLLSELLIFRDDWKFSVILYRINYLHRRIEHGGSLRTRDERFLDNALKLYPPKKKDSCMEYKVGLVRKMNAIMAEEAEKLL